MFLANIYLHILKGGHTEVVELLLKTPGIDVNAKSNDGYTPLIWAAGVSIIILNIFRISVYSMIIISS